MDRQPLASKSLIGVVSSTHLEAAARLMVDRNIGALGVYSSDQHVLLGVITERDITRAVAKGLDPARARINEVMSNHPVVAEGPVDQAEAARLMRWSHVRHLIIKQDGSDRIISLRDL